MWTQVLLAMLEPVFDNKDHGRRHGTGSCTGLLLVLVIMIMLPIIFVIMLLMTHKDAF